MDDANVDRADYYDVMTYADAQANSLVASPEPQAYLSEVPLIDDVLQIKKIIVPRMHSQNVNPSNEFHKEWQSAAEKELCSLTENNMWTLVPMPLNRHAIGCLWIFKIK